MTIQRCAAPLTSSHQTIFKLAAITYTSSSSTLRTSPPCSSRLFNSGSHLQFSSKRKLQTATSSRPHTLNSFPILPPPPRNTGIPGSSIASPAVPEINDTRPPRITTTSEHEQPAVAVPSAKERKEETSIVASVSEAEAQKSTPIITEPSAAPTPSKLKSAQSRLRPRKAAMALTPSAVAQLRHLLKQPDPKMIRVGVKNRGCSGLAYHLEYVEKPGAFDETVEQDGAKVLIESKALFSIIGSEMDWVEDKLNERFVFRNPNISE